MTHTIQTAVFAAVSLAVITALALLSLPAFASAASYAYVDATGEVRSVTANDWMSAIATAPNIHINSGVFLLRSAADFAEVGESVIVR